MKRALGIICLIVVFPLLLCSAEPKRISQAEAMERATVKIQPDYPGTARQLNVSGAVEVELIVGENGTVESATPVSGSPILTRPAVDALKRWKFKPLQENGNAAGFRTTIKVNFTR